MRRRYIAISFKHTGPRRQRRRPARGGESLRPPLRAAAQRKTETGSRGVPEIDLAGALAALGVLDAQFHLLRLARQRLQAVELGGARARIRDAVGQCLLAARNLAFQRTKLTVQVEQLAPALVSAEEIAGERLGAACGVGMAGASLRIAALGRAEGLQAFVAPGEVALGARRHVVLGAGAAMVAETLDRTAARAVLQANRVPV